MTTNATAPKPGWAKPASRRSTTPTSEDPTDALIRNQAERADEQPVADGSKVMKKKISLSIDAPLHKRLRHYCFMHETDVSKLLSELAEEFLAAQPK